MPVIDPLRPAKPWVFRNVPKGTHTIRAFAVRPWDEALKEPGAFAMVTFHVGEKDGKNTPDPKAPLLTGNRPKGKYPKGQAHMVLLDFLVRGCVVGDKDVPDSCRVRYRVDELPEVTLDEAGRRLAEGPSPRQARLRRRADEGREDPRGPLQPLPRLSGRRPTPATRQPEAGPPAS